jgi:hypothetical protein
MRKVLLGLVASALFATSAMAGGFGSNDGNQQDVSKAGKEAYSEARKNGAGKTHAGKVRDAAKATAEAANADARRDTKNGEVGVWIDDN